MVPPDYFDLDNGDFWRFTPSGLARLHKHYSQIISVGGWGNTMVPLINGLGLTWMPVPEAKWHPLNFLARTNRGSYAHVVWVIARTVEVIRGAHSCVIMLHARAPSAL